MKHKTSELTVGQLNLLVAQLEGKPLHHSFKPDPLGGAVRIAIPGAKDDLARNIVILMDYNPAGAWHDGGPIIERERIATEPGGDGWQATGGYFTDPRSARFNGPTPLIAAMRAFVASKLGEEVEIPDDHHATISKADVEGTLKAAGLPTDVMAPAFSPKDAGPLMRIPGGMPVCKCPNGTGSKSIDPEINQGFTFQCRGCGIRFRHGRPTFSDPLGRDVVAEDRA